MRLTFLGDISLCKVDYSSFSIDKQLREILDTSDLVVGNLECPITLCTEKLPYQAINLSAPKESLSILDYVNVVSLSNNHIRDYGNKGVFDTIDAISNCNIGYFGVGGTEEEALEPYVYEDERIRIAFIGATRYANAQSKEWGTSSDTNRLLFRKIKQLKKDGFFVIVYFHWGYEYVRVPSPRERRIAHRCIESGADFILGAHPHIFQGIEGYRGKSIAYSLGNFIFHSSLFDGMSPIEHDDRLFNSFVISLDVQNDMSYSFNVFDYVMSDEGVSLAHGVLHEQIMAELDAVSKAIVEKGYFKKYYMQSYAISKQNVRIRKDYQKASSLTFFQRLSLYRNANLQDLCNRIAGLIISLFQKIK